MKRNLVFCGLCMVLGGAMSLGLSMRPTLFATENTRSGAEVASFRDVVRKVQPAVVSIEAKPKMALKTTGSRPGMEIPFSQIPGLPEELREQFERYRQSPMVPQDQAPGRAMGSGFIIDASGLILTNDHVIRGADEVEVVMQDGRRFRSEEIRRDPKTDLAIVRIKAGKSLPYLTFADSTQVEIGDRVLAFGAPLGLTGSVTSGIVSAKGRDVHINDYEDFLQTDAAINPGNSGGPLVNLNGEVVGVNSVIKSHTGGFMGIGLAISSNMTQSVINQLQKNGKVVRGYLGVSVGPIPADVADRLKLPQNQGVLVAQVVAGSPAATAGLQDGDIVTAINGQSVKDPRSLQRLVASLPAGKPTEISIVRDNAKMTLSVSPADQPQNMARADGSISEGTSDSLGLRLNNLTAEMAKKMGFPEKTEGVVITGVEPGSPAAEAGLQPGMLIQKIDQKPVSNLDEARKRLGQNTAEQGVLLQVRSARQGVALVLVKPARPKN